MHRDGYVVLLQMFVGMLSNWEMVHYDAQLLGGIALCRKTHSGNGDRGVENLVVTCPLYLNAIWAQLPTRYGE